MEEGQFLKGLLHGKGKKTLKNGTVYEGEFNDGCFRKGRKISNGEVWIGCFKSGNPSGWVTVHKKHSEPLYRGHTETVTPEGEHKITWTRKLMSVYSQRQYWSDGKKRYSSKWSINVYEITPDNETTNFYTIVEEFESKPKKEKRDIRKQLRAEFGKFTRAQIDQTLAKPLLQTEGEDEGEEEIDVKMPPGCVGQVKTKCATAGVKAGVGLVMAAAI